MTAHGCWSVEPVDIAESGVTAGPGASIVSVAGVGAMVDGGYTSYNIGVTSRVARGGGPGHGGNVCGYRGQCGRQLHGWRDRCDRRGSRSIRSTRRSPVSSVSLESDTGTPGGDTNADVLVYKVNMSQAIDGSTIDGGDFGIYARGLDNAPVTIDDATLTVRSGAATRTLLWSLAVSTQRFMSTSSRRPWRVSTVPLSCVSHRWIRFRSRHREHCRGWSLLLTGVRFKLGCCHVRHVQVTERRISNHGQLMKVTKAERNWS